ncbi:MAG: hypothetical protein L0K89_02120 [Bifidobacterium crudilactis]|nr:hypothetical protein [Bifidobacterium crudilactis]
MQEAYLGGAREGE